jgi:hypothetical protein
MIEVLKRLKNDYGVFEIKAEFEAEGSRMEELMRLKDITSSVGLPIILKIGGVEAVTDVYNALSIGVKGIIAPMVETPFALGKYLNMIKTMIVEDNAQDIEFAFNVETITACENIKSMLDLSDTGILTGITIGRVDLAGSIGVSREQINTSSKISNLIEMVLDEAKEYKLKIGLGGAISKEAIFFIREHALSLHKFETRKVVFPVEAISYGEKPIIEANRFELLWLQSKCRYYSRIKVEDDKRIQMLEERVK